MTPARHNPFNDQRLDAIHYLDPQDEVTSVRAQWDAAGRRGAIVGPHGSGKTALLRAIHRSLLAAQCPAILLRVDGRAPDLSTVPNDTVLLIDGGETLGYFGLRRFLRQTHPRPLLLTLHRPCTLRTVHRASMSPERVEQLIRALAPEQSDRLVPHVPRLMDAHRGNLHEILQALYHLVADR